MSIRKAEVIYIGDAASIVRAAKQAEDAQARVAAAAKKSGDEVAAANRKATDATVAGAGKQQAAHAKTVASVGSIGSAFTKMTAPILIGAAAGAKFAIDFQAQMERVHTQAGVTQQGVEQLSKGVLGMAGKVAQAPQALADGMYHVASSLNATLPAATRYNTELKVLQTAAEGARVGNANLVDVTNALDAAVVSGIKGVGNFSQAMGALNAVVGAGDMTMQDLADALGTGILGPMKTFGVTLKDVGGALAVFGDNNIRGADAATKLISAVRIMAAPSKAAAKELATVGLGTLSLANDIRTGGLTKALTDLKTHLKDSGDTAAQQGLVVARAFGGRQSTGVQLLLGQLDRLKTKTQEVGAGAQGFGNAWSATQQTAAYKMQSALDSMKADITGFGNAVLPPLLSVGSTIVKDVDKVAQAFASLPSGAQHAIVTGGLILAGIGPALKILGVFSSGIGKLWQITQLISGARVVGGLGAGAGGAGAAATGAESAAATGGIAATLKSGLSRGIGGLALGGMGVLIAQTVGSAVHGGVGEGIKTIGTDTAIGAGLGSIFGPAGTAGGALIGGLVGSLQFFIADNAARQGKEWAQKFTADLPHEISSKTQAALARAKTQVLSAGPTAHPSLGMNRTGATGTAFDAAQRASESKTLVKAFFNQGYTAGQAVIQGLKSVKTPSTQILFSDFLLKLKALPAQARPEAARLMLEYAHGLEANKRLPKGAVNDMIGMLENQFPPLRGYLKNQGLQTDRDFAEALKFTNATATLKNTLSSYRTQFGDLAISTKLTEGNINQNTMTAMADLQSIIVTSVGQTRRDAVAELRKLQQQTNSTFKTMGSQVASAAGDMHQSVKDGSSLAYKDGAANWSKFAKSVGGAMAAGVLSVKEGAKIIGDGLNAVLKSFGEKPLSLTQIQGLGPDITQAIASGQISSGGAASPHARGGIVQFGRAGDRGHDNIPVNFGGMSIAVGSGEVGAVFNHTQQRVANSLLAPVGGLPGLFSNYTRPHYMAGGGLIGSRPSASYGQLEGLWTRAGGPKGLASLMAAIAEAESGGQDVMQQGQPWATTGWGYWQITPGGPQYFDPMTNAREAVSKYRSQGLGAWTTYTSGAYKRFLQGGVPALGGLGSSIKTPSVIGKGTVATIVRRVLAKMATAANTYASGHSSLGGASVPGGGASSGPGGLAVFGGVTMAKWIANELSWATQHGWHGQPTSGYRPGRDSHTSTGTSEHALIAYPGGAVDFGGYNDPAAYATKLALVQLAGRLGYPGPRLRMPIGFHDDGHLSGTGHARGGMVPYVGAFKDGGYVNQTGMGLLHKGETVIPRLASGGLLYPLDALITSLTDRQSALQGQSPFTLSPAQIAANKRKIDQLRQDRTNLPIPASGKSGDAQRLANAKERKKIELEIQKLEANDRAKGNAAEIAKSLGKIDSQLKSLNQLKAFKDAIAGVKTQMKDLASQAAQAWRTIQEGGINKAHDAAIAAVGNSAAATTLAAMQAQDTKDQAAATLAGLQATLGTDQALVTHSGGQTHLDALAAVKADQAAIDAFNRQQTEQQLQDNIDAATKKADDAQTVALAGLDQQTADYQASLDTQFGALDANLQKRKITYAQWAHDVNAILSQYGLSVATDSGTEAAITASPGNVTASSLLGSGAKVHHHVSHKHHRAGGGPVEPGYVYRVGEHGPEDVAFGRPGVVMTASQTRRNSGAKVNIEKAYFTGTQAARAFADRLAFRAAIGTA